jgi:hypothetical protein
MLDPRGLEALGRQPECLQDGGRDLRCLDDGGRSPASRRALKGRAITGKVLLIP